MSAFVMPSASIDSRGMEWLIAIVLSHSARVVVARAVCSRILPATRLRAVMGSTTWCPLSVVKGVMRIRPVPCAGAPRRGGGGMPSAAAQRARPSILCLPYFLF